MYSALNLNFTSMAKEKRIEAEFHLPESIIQHIQSFLSAKEAAQTTILSKSWYGAWLTRPNLDFDQHDFLGELEDPIDVDKFQEYMKKTMQRYEQLNRKIKSLRLCMCDLFFSSVRQTVAKDVIIKAIKSGVVDLYVKFEKDDTLFALPHEVFESENLVRLFVNGCKVDLGADGKICCLRLESLSLDRVSLEDDQIIWNIISSCPLIESLSLSLCSANNNDLSTSSFVKGNVGSVVGEAVNMRQFRRLKSLLLNEVNLDASFFSDFSSVFPCLEELALCECYGSKVIRICSPSLECIKFTWLRNVQMQLELDVPRIHKFTFSGFIPCLSIKTGRSKWESDISILRSLYNQGDMWFLSLNNFLTKLSQSKVSLTLRISSQGFYSAEILKGLPTPVVENLTIIRPSPVSPAMWGILLRCCRPSFLTQTFFGPEETRSNNWQVVAYNKLMEQAIELCTSANQIGCGPCGVGEGSWEFYDAAVSAWRPLLSWSSARPEDEKRVRVALIWG